jgi:hypothetical protein
MATNSSPDETVKTSKLHRASFQALPTELICIIMRELSSAMLLRIATLCKRLHFIAITCYVKREQKNPNGSHPYRFAGFDPNLGAFSLNGSFLRVLRFALFPRTLQNVQVCFDRSESIAKVECVASVLNMMDHVEQAYLWFDCVSSSSNEEHTKKLEAFCEVLQALRGKSCTSLYVSGERGSDAGHFEVGFSPAELNELNRLTLTTSVPFSPLFRTWTLATINGSPLEELSIDCGDLEKSDWEEILATVENSMLKKLHISMKSGVIGNGILLSDFLNRHELESLTVVEHGTEVSTGLVPWNAVENAEIWPNSHLRELSGTPEFLSAFIVCLVPAFKFSSLTTVSLRVMEEPTCPTSLSTLFGLLPLLETMDNLSLDFWEGTDALSWLHPLASEQDPAPLHNVTQVEISFSLPECSSFLKMLDIVIVVLLRFPELQTVRFPELETDMLNDCVEGGTYGFVKALQAIHPKLLIMDIGHRVEGVEDWLAQLEGDDQNLI